MALTPSLSLGFQYVSGGPPLSVIPCGFAVLMTASMVGLCLIFKRKPTFADLYNEGTGLRRSRDAINLVAA